MEIKNFLGREFKDIYDLLVLTIYYIRSEISILKSSSIYCVYFQEGDSLYKNVLTCILIYYASKSHKKFVLFALKFPKRGR
jgi:hypothetical protein